MDESRPRESGERRFVFDTGDDPNGFYKFVVVTPGNHLNCWVPEKK